MENCALEMLWRRNRNTELKKKCPVLSSGTQLQLLLGSVVTHKYLRTKARVLALAPTNTGVTLHKRISQS